MRDLLNLLKKIYLIKKIISQIIKTKKLSYYLKYKPCAEPLEFPEISLPSVLDFPL